MIPSTVRPFLKPLLASAALSLVLWGLQRELAAYPPGELMRAAESVPASQLTFALALTAAGYVLLTLYDTLALRYLASPLPYRKTALASFVSFAFAINTGGLSLIAGGGLRYRFYTSWGLSPTKAARAVLFCTATTWLGFCAMTGSLLLVSGAGAAPLLQHLPAGTPSVAGALLVSPVVLYGLWAYSRKPLKARGWEFSPPALPIAFGQVVLSMADWTVAAAVLYSLLSKEAPVSFGFFLMCFMLAQCVGLVSTVPGGLGIFEGSMVLLLAGRVAPTALLGPLLVFRLVYYLFPLSGAAVMLGFFEWNYRKGRFASLAEPLSRFLGLAVPPVFALSLFVAGGYLLFTGSLPVPSGRIEWIRRYLPFPLFDLSHFTASLSGAGLMILAGSLWRQMASAWAGAVLLLSVGFVASALHRAHWRASLLLLVLVAVLLASRTHFHRRAALTSEPLSPRWIAAAAVVTATVIWTGLFLHRHVEYDHSLWWQFTFDGSASRFLRASAGAAAALMLASLSVLLGRGTPPLSLPSPADLDRAAGLADLSPRTGAQLALLGDKVLIFGSAGDSFLMYRRRGRSWVAMGDPVGPHGRAEELVWTYLNICDRYDGWPVFYEAGPLYLSLYRERGLAALKIGEEGRTDLSAFSLSGSARKGLRGAVHHLEKEGYVFEVIEPDALPPHLADLRRISDQWLESKGTREKGFSLGFFSEEYLRRFPCAVVRRGEEIFAFANLWRNSRREELSVDLMRHRPSSPHGIMDFLFARIMLWAKEEGYRWFNLGMAPLAGMEEHSLSPVWSRLGAFLYRHGEHFYNFQGLRNYKEKFDPVWEPRYLVSPGGLALPGILLDAAALVSRGAVGIVSR